MYSLASDQMGHQLNYFHTQRIKSINSPSNLHRNPDFPQKKGHYIFHNIQQIFLQIGLHILGIRGHPFYDNLLIGTCSLPELW